MCRSLYICVFCSSSDFIPAEYKQAAADLAEAIASAGHHIVYGGGNNGLMGILAKTLKRRGQKVIGVIPRALVERGLAFDQCDQLVVTSSLRERKALMEHWAHAFLALPGGVGTIEELLESVALKQLGYHAKPIAVLNTSGYFDPLLAQMERSVALGFATPDLLDLYYVAETPTDALRYLESHLAEHIARGPGVGPAD
ncbi:MAG: LOG family protein [Armatimonadota bacterium]